MLKLLAICLLVVIDVHSKSINETPNQVSNNNNNSKTTATSQVVVDNIFNEKLVEGVVVDEPDAEVKTSKRQSRKRVTSIRDTLQCGFDVSCFLDTVEAVLQERKEIILAEADSRYLKSSVARKSSGESPSELTDAVEGIISKMTDIVKDTVGSWFQDDKDDEDGGEKHDVEKEEEDEEEEDREEKQSVEESRGKKKKKLKSLMKLLILGAVLKAKLTVLLQLLSAALQVKFFFIALTGLIINKIRLWYDLKKGHHPQKVIYYEHAQHQHHYDHLEDDHHGGFWGRAYEVPEEESEEHAQEIAYRAQKPQRPIPWSPPQQRYSYEYQ